MSLCAKRARPVDHLDKIKAKLLFTLGNSFPYAMPNLHSCVAASPIVQAQHMAHVTSNRHKDVPLIQKDVTLMAYTNTTSAAGLGLMARLANVVKSTKEALNRRRIYNQTVSELRTLSTRELNDLGIARSMITRVALEAAYGK